MKHLTETPNFTTAVVAAPTAAVVVQHTDAVRAQRRARHLAPVGELQRSAAPHSSRHLSLVEDKAARSAFHQLQQNATLQAENQEYIRQLTTASSWSRFSAL